MAESTAAPPPPAVKPKLYILYLTDAATTGFTPSILPSPNKNDVTLMIRDSAADDAEYEVGIHVAGTEAPYVNKRSSNTILACCSKFNNLSVGVVEEAASDATFYFYKPGVDPGPAVVAILDKTIKSSEEMNVEISEIEGWMKVFTTGGKYTGSVANASGLMSAIAERTYTPRSIIGGPVTVDDSFSASTPEGIIALINRVLPAIVYDGFNQAKVRRRFIARSGDPSVAVRDLLLVFSAYAFIGNNTGKLTIKRVDVAIGKELMEAVAAMGIKKVDRTSEGLTLPRLAISFMPEYLMFRKFIAEDLQSQTESTINVHYKDIVFYGCSTIRDMTGYNEFHKEFSAFIFNKDADSDLNVAQFEKSYARWNKIVMKGYNSDTAIHARMATAVSTLNMSKRGVYDFILTGINTTYATP
jgi:hypothetical protein